MNRYAHSRGPELDVPEALPVLAIRIVDDRQLRLELLPDCPSFRLTFTDRFPHLLGHITELDTPTPALAAVALYKSWAAADPVRETLLDIARFTWHHRVRLLAEAA